MTVQEKWKDIVGLEGRYEISSFGRVRSYLSSRKTPWKKGPKVVKPRPNDKGYLRVHIGGRDQYIHRLVLTAFIGECPEGCDTAHLDCNPANNDLRNLSWMTQAEKLSRQAVYGNRVRGELSKQAKLSQQQVEQVRRLIESGMSLRRIGLLFGVSQSAISLIKTGKNWRQP